MATSTPWGKADNAEKIAPGVMRYDTPSHGGFHLSPTRNAKVPAEWRAASFGKAGERGWYEEDCDAILVVMAFPDLFDAAMVERAREGFKRWFPTLTEA